MLASLGVPGSCAPWLFRRATHRLDALGQLAPTPGGTSDAAADRMTERNIRSRLLGVNVPRNERIAMALGGAVAIALGVRHAFDRRPIAGGLLAAVGSAALLRAATGRCPAYRARAARKGIQIRRAVTVQSSPREVYELWRDFSNLPRFLKHISQITTERTGRSHWIAQVGGRRLEWDVEIVEDVAPRRLRWRSLPGGDVRHEGTLELRAAPGDHGTVVEIKLHWLPPGGVFVAAPLYTLLRKLASVEVGRDLARFQQLIETGEVTTGARRLDELPVVDSALAGSAVGAAMPSAVTTAETSAWTQHSDPTGGAR
jgi:uncharacterized membrane protein